MMAALYITKLFLAANEANQALILELARGDRQKAKEVQDVLEQEVLDRAEKISAQAVFDFYGKIIDLFAEQQFKKEEEKQNDQLIN